jgi:pSer/pThr/pTyr-binding forkhead associated (FHA) protein
LLPGPQKLSSSFTPLHKKPEKPLVRALVVLSVTMAAHAALLLVANGVEFDGAKYTIDEQGMCFGRGTDNRIMTADASVSRNHFQVVYQEGSFYLRDVGSTRGTFIYLAPYDRLQLEVGTMIKTAASEFTVMAISKNNLKLQFTEGVMAERVIEIGEDAAVFGRGTHCSVCIADPILSDTHCEIKLDRGRFYLQDLRSTNGTGIRLSKSQAPSQLRLLTPDLVFGGVNIKFTVHPPSAGETPTGMVDRAQSKNIHGLVVQILHVDQFRSVYQRNNKRSGVKVISLCM